MFWAMISKKVGNAPRATDLKRRNKSSASLIKESPATGTYSEWYAALLGGGIDPLASLFVGGRHPDRKLSSAGLCKQLRWSRDIGGNTISTVVISAVVGKVILCRVLKGLGGPRSRPPPSQGEKQWKNPPPPELIVSDLGYSSKDVLESRYFGYVSGDFCTDVAPLVIWLQLDFHSGWCALVRRSPRLCQAGVRLVTSGYP